MEIKILYNFQDENSLRVEVTKEINETEKSAKEIGEFLNQVAEILIMGEEENGDNGRDKS